MFKILSLRNDTRKFFKNQSILLYFQLIELFPNLKMPKSRDSPIYLKESLR